MPKNKSKEEIVIKKDIKDHRYSYGDDEDLRPTMRSVSQEEAEKQISEKEVKKEEKVDSKVPKKQPQKQFEKKKPVETLQQALKNENVKSVNFGVVGIGHAGNRIAEQFFKFGYETIALNTAKQDLSHISIPEENKILMDYTLGGAGKDLSLGQEAMTEYAEQTAELMYDKFQDIDQYLLVCGGGGGSGSGGITTLIQIASSLRDLGGLPIVLIYTLPLENEGATVQSNAIKTLDKLATLVRDEVITSLIVVDNSRIQQKYSEVSMGRFWDVANFDITNTFHTFNVLTACDSKYVNLDPMDYTRVLASGNCTILGKKVVPVEIQDGQMLMEDDELARALIDTIHSGLLAEGFNLQETVRTGVILTARNDILNQIPAINVNFALETLKEHTGDAAVFNGIYADENKRDEITVYALFSGLGLPRERIDSLLAKAEESIQKVEEKQADKNKMHVLDRNFSEPTQSAYDKMKRKSTSFGKMINRRRGRTGRSR